MKEMKFFIGNLLLVVALGSCSKGAMHEYAVAVPSDMNSKEEASPSSYVSSSAAVANPQDTTHRFIRTADLKFRVKDVIRSTYDIEDIAVRQGGFVVRTQLASTIDYTTSVRISPDSSLVSTYYTLSNIIVLKVPNAKLDATLREIARNIDFLDFRTIHAEDVTLQILTNELTQKRIAKNENQLVNAIDKRGRKSDETTSAEELLLNKQEEADNAKVSNLSLADQINFSTITLSIYQRQSVKLELVANNTYKPGLGTRLLEAFRQGWDILPDVLIFIVRLWWLIVLGVVVYLIYRIYRRKIKKNKND